jgi:hypothetical protein
MKSISSFMPPPKSLFKTLALACALNLAPSFTPVASAQVTVGPMEVWTPFQFSPTKPRLVVLLHGVTPKREESPEQDIGKSGHARHYWGFNLIKGLQGESNEPKMNVITPAVFGVLRGRTTVYGDWVPNTTDKGALDLAPICFPFNLGSITPAMAQSQSAMKTYIKLMTAAANTMVMVGTRDGSKHLMPQVAETIEEITMSYKIAFGSLPEARQPQIYLVCHSFGGIVARTLLANPTAPDLFGNKLSANQRAMADYLRKRVVLVYTMGTPYEGSPIGDVASDLSDFVSQKGPGIIAKLIKDWNVEVQSNGKEMTAAQLKVWIQGIVDKGVNFISGKRDCLADVSYSGMAQYNAGILKPNVERRRTNGDLVPFFTAAGRNPGHQYIDDDRGVFYLQDGGGLDGPYNPISMFDIAKGPRAANEAFGLYLIEGLMHLYGYGREGKRPWGTAEAAIGDRFSGPFTGIGPATARSVSASWQPDETRMKSLINLLFDGRPYIQFDTDGEWDSDGFCGWDSAHAYHLTGTNFYRLYDNTFYGSNLPWDIDHHGSMMFSAANGAWIHNELIRQAGPLVRAGARRSVWGPSDNPVTPSNSLRVEILELKDAKKELDTFSGADFYLRVRINGQSTTRTLPEGDTHTNLPPFNHSGIPNTVIPIQITAIDLDDPDYDDICVMSNQKAQSTLYLFYDTRTNKIMGDVQGEGGEILVIKPKGDHSVETKIRITQIQPE